MHNLVRDEGRVPRKTCELRRNRCKSRRPAPVPIRRPTRCLSRAFRSGQQERRLNLFHYLQFRTVAESLYHHRKLSLSSWTVR
ncbi:Uncharacterized protein HZ326_6543 [Fusarium oxysporum f. sp. albedinis]|nr:Uncharacterized protein HZ326_6543 [Fusarium oxysporum f. sp. albedinis]